MTDVFLEEFDENEPDGVWPFRELVGILMWLANQTRPDISNAVRAAARFAHTPKLKHWVAARGILEYLKVTSGFGITLQRGSGLELMVYADAAYTPKDTKRKSVSGAAVMCRGTAIQWISRTHKCTTLSSSETEYVAMAEGFKEAISCGTCGAFYCLILGIRASRFSRIIRVRSRWQLTP